MTARRPRAPGRRGPAWFKAGTRPITAVGDKSIDLGGRLVPWLDVPDRLPAYEGAVHKTGDAAALVEAVRHCVEHGVPPPAWIVAGLDELLAEFVSLGSGKIRGKRLQTRPARFKGWARASIKAYMCFTIAEYFEGFRDQDGLTTEEAIDATRCALRGSALESMTQTRDQVKEALKTARKNARAGWFQRNLTQFDQSLGRLFFTPPPKDPADHHWWAINRARQGARRGEWKERPRLLADLKPAELAKEGKAAQERWRRRHL